MTLGAALGSAHEDEGSKELAVRCATGNPSGGTLPLSERSRFAQRLRRRYRDELPLLAPGIPTRASMDSAYQALRDSRGFDIGAALRVLRQLVMERLMVLDCDEQAPLGAITLAVTELAEFALDVACQ